MRRFCGMGSEIGHLAGEEESEKPIAGFDSVMRSLSYAVDGIEHKE